MDFLRDAIPALFVAVAALLVGREAMKGRSGSAGQGSANVAPVVPDSAAQPVPVKHDVLSDLAKQPRGIRNNNPGNIRWDGVTQWRGMVAADPAGFVIFDKPENGIRAMSRILDSYAGRGVITLEQIINTWAPPSENNTAAYVSHLAAVLGIAPGQAVTDRPGLIAGIIKHENGSQPYDLETIRRGVALA